MFPHNKPLLWLRGEVKTPPFSKQARTEAGELLRRLQRGETLRMPSSRPMPVIGPRCHHTWRVVYRTDSDAIIILEVFDKNQNKTPKSVIECCKQRLIRYDQSHWK
jgi:phage-related protein